MPSFRKNYRKLYEEVLEGLDSRPTLLLHICCAPCSSSVLEELTKYFQVTAYYYNPNISPKEEYEERLSEVKRLLSSMPFPEPVPLLSEPYDPTPFNEAAKGVEGAKEGGERCARCFSLRLRKTAEIAKNRGFSYFTTTLTVSPLKNADLLNEIGTAMGEEYGVPFLLSDFKKKNGYLRSLELSRQYHLYRQNYCGCRFSKNEAEKVSASKEINVKNERADEAIRMENERADEAIRVKNERADEAIHTENERVYATVNRSAIQRNLLACKALCPPETGFIAVLKADAYGHGAVSLGRFLESSIAMAAVATPAEAIELRKGGFQKPILLLSDPLPGWEEKLIENDVRPSLFTAKQVETFSLAAKRVGKTGYYHIAVDTGMNRIGLTPDEEGRKEIDIMRSYPFVVAEGIFSHLATMDMADNRPAYAQENAFRTFLTRLSENGITFPYVHIANSAAILLAKGFSYPLVRLGISLYGILPSEEIAPKGIHLEPALSLYSRISYVKTVKKGEFIGYGGTYQTTRDSRIATVSVGYGDGYPRSLSNVGSVLLHGIKAPIVGRICMDQMMIDVTEIPNVREGEEVVLIGESGEASISLTELSRLSHRFPYEFLCNLSKRVPRVYI